MLEELVSSNISRSAFEKLYTSEDYGDTFIENWQFQFNKVALLLADSKDYINLGIPVFGTSFPDELKSKSYSEFPFNAMNKLLIEQAKILDEHAWHFQKLSKASNTVFDKLKSEYKQAMLAQKQGVKFEIGDSFVDFNNKNRAAFGTIFLSTYGRLNLYNELTDLYAKLEAKNSFKIKFNLAKALHSEAVPINQRLAVGTKFAEDLSKESQETIEVMEEHLISFIKGEKSAKNFKKLLCPEQKPIFVMNEPKVMTPSQTRIMDQVIKSVDENELSLLTKYGLSRQDATSIILGKRSEDTFDYISALENQFIQRNLPVEEAFFILQKNPDLLTSKRGYMQRYISLIDNLFDIHDPTQVSGILPRYQSQIFKNVETLESYLMSKAKQNMKISIDGLEKIEVASDKELLQKKLEISPFVGIQIKKYIGGKSSGAKTAMYETYSGIAGEGHFRKVQFGENRRAVIKLAMGDDGNTKVNVVEYFKTHTQYDKFYS